MWDRQVAAQAATGSQYYATDPTVVAEQMRSLIPLRRCGTTDEVARVVAFLLSSGLVLDGDQRRDRRRLR